MNDFTREELEQIAATTLLAADKAARMVVEIDAKIKADKKFNDLMYGKVRTLRVFMPWHGNSRFNALPIFIGENGASYSRDVLHLADLTKLGDLSEINPSERRAIKQNCFRLHSVDKQADVFVRAISYCPSCYHFGWHSEKQFEWPWRDDFEYGRCERYLLDEGFFRFFDKQKRGPIYVKRFCWFCTGMPIPSKSRYALETEDAALNYRAKIWVDNRLSQRKSQKRKAKISKAWVDVSNEIESYTEEEGAKADVYLYIMKCKHTNRYKIGKSVNPEYRERTLQSSQPDIQMVAKFNNLAHTEKAWHNYYQDYKVRGEWFNLTEQQVRWMVSVCRKGEEEVWKVLTK